MEELRVVRESKAKFRIAWDDEPTMEDRDNYRDWTWHLTHPQQETFGGLSDEWIIQSARSQAIMTDSFIEQAVVGFDQSLAAIAGLTQTDPAISGAVQSQTTFATSMYGSRLMPLSIENDLIRPALEVLQQTEDTDIASQAKEILVVLQRTILVVLQRRITTFYYGFTFDQLPSLHAVNVEDGSTLLEWIFDDFRIGFSIEKERNESSWYLVSSKKMTEMNAYGYISLGNEFEKLMMWLLDFVISHT